MKSHVIGTIKGFMSDEECDRILVYCEGAKVIGKWDTLDLKDFDDRVCALMRWDSLRTHDPVLVQEQFEFPQKNTVWLILTGTRKGWLIANPATQVNLDGDVALKRHL